MRFSISHHSYQHSHIYITDHYGKCIKYRYTFLNAAILSVLIYLNLQITAPLHLQIKRFGILNLYFHS